MDIRKSLGWSSAIAAVGAISTVIAYKYVPQVQILIDHVREQFGDLLGDLKTIQSFSQVIDLLFKAGIGALLILNFLQGRVIRNEQLESKKRDKMLTFSYSGISSDGNLRLLNQLEEALGRFLADNPGDVDAIEKASKYATDKRMVLDLPIEQEESIYSRIRNKLYPHIANSASIVSDDVIGLQRTEIKFTGLILKEPQYTKDKTGKIVIDTSKGKKAETESKNRLLVFPNVVISLVVMWGKQNYEKLGYETFEKLIDELCHDINGNSIALDNLIKYMLGIEKESNLDEYIGDGGKIPRDYDKMRFVALAQMIRHLVVEKRKGMRFSTFRPNDSMSPERKSFIDQHTDFVNV